MLCSPEACIIWFYPTCSINSILNLHSFNIVNLADNKLTDVIIKVLCNCQNFFYNVMIVALIISYTVNHLSQKIKVCTITTADEPLPVSNENSTQFSAK
jgi:hypothetical protein